MPELPSGVANLYLMCSSKSPGLAPFQTRNVCLDLSLVSWPLMTPSLTDQYSSRPSQPVRSLPLKMVMKPSLSVLVAGGLISAAINGTRARTNSADSAFLMGSYSGGETFVRHNGAL